MERATRTRRSINTVENSRRDCERSSARPIEISRLDRNAVARSREFLASDHLRIFLSRTRRNRCAALRRNRDTRIAQRWPRSIDRIVRFLRNSRERAFRGTGVPRAEKSVLVANRFLRCARETRSKRARRLRLRNARNLVSKESSTESALRARARWTPRWKLRFARREETLRDETGNTGARSTVLTQLP